MKNNFRENTLGGLGHILAIFSSLAIATVLGFEELRTNDNMIRSIWILLIGFFGLYLIWKSGKL